MVQFTILKDLDRYQGLGKHFPDEIIVTKGTREQAIRLANYLTNYYAGCDDFFSVEGVDEVEHLKVGL